MTDLKDKFDPIDIIALMIVIGCITSMAIRGDTLFKDVLQTVVGFYFGRNSTKNDNDLKPPKIDNKAAGFIIFILLTQQIFKHGLW